MAEDAASQMKARLRSDLRVAIKKRLTVEVKVLRTLVAALDNAEAPPVPAAQQAAAHLCHGSAEVERLLLDGAQVRDILLTELHERDGVAKDLERRGEIARAEALRAEVLLIRRYV